MARWPWVCVGGDLLREALASEALAPSLCPALGPPLGASGELPALCTSCPQQDHLHHPCHPLPSPWGPLVALDIHLAACWEVELNTGHGIPGRADQGKEGTVQVSDSPVLEGVRVGRLPALGTTPARPLQLDPPGYKGVTLQSSPLLQKTSPPSPVGCARCSLEFVVGSALMEPFAAGEANPVLERTNHLWRIVVEFSMILKLFSPVFSGSTEGHLSRWDSRRRSRVARESDRRFGGGFTRVCRTFKSRSENFSGLLRCTSSPMVWQRKNQQMSYLCIKILDKCETCSCLPRRATPGGEGESNSKVQYSKIGTLAVNIRFLFVC